jgi:hypothetical protein
MADVTTPEARRGAYSMLLTRAVIRVGLPMPTDADFELVSVEDPYGFASQSEVSLFRRPPVMANLRFNTTLMWDGRETAACATLTDDLHQQAIDATTTHAQGSTPPTTAVDDIVRSELGTYFAQQTHSRAGELTDDGALGGPTFLAQVRFYWGMNDFEKTDPEHRPYTPEVFTLYQAWRGLSGVTARDAARAQIAEGERVFDSREFTVPGVSGFNDELGRADITATCGACHNTPNVGTNSEGRLMDIGVSDEAHRSADLPLYTLSRKVQRCDHQDQRPGPGAGVKEVGAHEPLQGPQLAWTPGTLPLPARRVGHLPRGGRRLPRSALWHWPHANRESCPGRVPLRALKARKECDPGMDYTVSPMRDHILSFFDRSLKNADNHLRDAASSQYPEVTVYQFGCRNPFVGVAATLNRNRALCVSSPMKRY